MQGRWELLVSRGQAAVLSPGQPTVGGTTAGPGAQGSVTGPGGTSTVTGPGLGGTAGAAGDTKHCAGGKQFALKGFIATPPCQPTFSGTNGGATYRGVTASEVTVVYYLVKDSAAVNAITAGRGLVPTAAELKALLDAEQAFINKRYELWGRKLKLVSYQSPSCMGTPPSDDCFRQDARTLVSQVKPFAVVFPQNATAPGFQDELAKAGVINLGGHRPAEQLQRQPPPVPLRLHDGRRHPGRPRR